MAAGWHRPWARFPSPRRPRRRGPGPVRRLPRRGRGRTLLRDRDVHCAEMGTWTWASSAARSRPDWSARACAAAFCDIALWAMTRSSRSRNSLGIEGQDRAVEQPPVLDPPGDVRVAVALIGEVLPHQQQPRGHCALRRARPRHVPSRESRPIRPFENRMNRTYEGLSHDFWASGLEGAGLAIARCNSAFLFLSGGLVMLT
jgi:hypothetical protein